MLRLNEDQSEVAEPGAGGEPAGRVSVSGERRVVQRWARHLRHLPLPTMLLSATLLGWLVWSFWSSSKDVEDEKLRKVRALTETAASEVDQLALRARVAARFVADGLSNGCAAFPAGIADYAEQHCSCDDSSLRAPASCLRAILESEPMFYGASITYKAQGEPRSTYFLRSEPDGAVVGGTILPEYLHSQAPEYWWYREPIATGTDAWSPPYDDPAGETLMTTYSAVFGPNDPKTGTRVASGVVTVDISSDQIRALVQNLDLGESGYGALTSADGTYLYHPNSEYVKDRKTIQQVAEERNDEDRDLMWTRIKESKSGWLPHKSTTTGEDSWLVYTQLPNSGWSLQNTFIKRDLIDVNVLRHELVGAAAAAGAFLLALLAHLLDLRATLTRRWWVFSIGAAATFACEIAIIWALALHYSSSGTDVAIAPAPLGAATMGPSVNTSQSNAAPTRTDAGLASQECEASARSLLKRGDPPRRVADPASVEKLKDAYRTQARCRHASHPVFVDVGMSLENLKFIGANEVQTGGYIWQRIPKEAADFVRPGFTIGNAIGVSLQRLDNHVSPDGSMVWRWKFDAVVAQDRSSTRYPIEQETVLFRLRHEPFETARTSEAKPVVPTGVAPAPDPIRTPQTPTPVVSAEGNAEADHEPVADGLVATESTAHESRYQAYLVPALSDYEVNAPSARPGINPSLVVPGWYPRQSHFELAARSSGSNLGIDNQASELTPPELAFAVLVERDFADAFISNLTPIIVVAIMLFAVLMVSASLDYGRALSICMGMFFVIVFSHIDLRQRLAAQEIFYLEYFYFAIYAGILFVSFTCLLKAFQTRIELFELRDRFLLKALYWPSLLGALYVRTLLTFY